MRSGDGSTTPEAGGDDGATSEALDPGHLVAGRFRVERLIGRGGMGEVYEAQDLLLGERVALKTVRRDRAGEPAAARFRREIQLARKVTHRNVCRIFEVAVEGGTVVVAMELLAGETLAQRLRGGRLSPKQALPIVRQLAAGLDAAHEAGVVHRDLKSANIVLDGERAVITDFGIARGQDLDGDVLTTAGGFVGSPAYMAPEQVSGDPVTARSDVYALGVVLFEALTGRLPFRGENLLETAARRLREAPPSPRALAPEVPPSWDAAILRCLALRPEDRFASAGDVARALEQPRPRALGALALLAAVLAGSTLMLLKRPDAPVKLPQRPAVAMLGLSGDSWVGDTAEELLASVLSSGERLRRLAPGAVIEARARLALDELDRPSTATLRRLHELLAADLYVSGAVTVAGNQVRIAAHVQDATGAVIASATESGSVDELVDLVLRAGVELRRALGVASDAAVLRRDLPATAKAARFLVEGTHKFDRGECLAARDLLQLAVAEDDRLLSAWTGLEEALECVGSDTSQAQARALELAAGRPGEELLRAVDGEPGTAIEPLRAAWDRDPDDDEVTLAYAAALRAAGRWDELATVLDAQRRRSPPVGGNPILVLYEAQMEGARSQYARALALAERAERAAAARGAGGMVGGARTFQSLALVRLGRIDEAVARLKEAVALRKAAGARRDVVAILNRLARAQLDVGQLEDARRTAEEAVVRAHELDASSLVHESYNALSMVLQAQGDLAGALRALDADLAGEAHPETSLAVLNTHLHRAQLLLLSMGRFGDGRDACRLAGKGAAAARAPDLLQKADACEIYVEWQGGELDRALTHTRVLAARLDVHDPYNQLRTDMLAHEILLDAGRPAQVEPLARRAIATLLVDHPPEAAEVTAALARALVEQGKVAGARGELDRARALLARYPVAETKVLVEATAARVAADPAEAERLARSALAQATSMGAGRLALETRVLLGSILLRRDRAAGRRELAAVERDARAAGYLLYADQARAFSN